MCCYDHSVPCILQVNPPYYVRLVELVPHPDTLPTAMDIAFELMTEVGQAPVRLRKEIDGFALNRVQYAIIAESWRLVKVSPIRSSMNITPYKCSRVPLPFSTSYTHSTVVLILSNSCINA